MRSSSNVSKDGDNIYYNITIVNNGLEPKLARFDETRREVIICNPDEYYLTIARFTVPLNSVPIFIFPIQSGSTQVNPNLSTLSITLTHKASNTDYTVNLIYVPDNDEPVPPPPSANAPNYDQTDSIYYYVYTYTKLIELTNDALSIAFTTLKGDYPAIGATEAPYFIYDSETQLISLIAQASFYDVNDPLSEIEIWGNVPITSVYYEAMQTFHALSVSGFAIDKATQFLITSDPHNEHGYAPFGVTPSVPPSHIILKQEYKILEYWNSFRNLLFSSNTLPIRNEYIPGENALIDPLNGSGINNFFPILTDFEPLLSLAGDSRSILNYVADGQYRLIDLMQADCIRKFDLQLYWVDNNNLFHPLELFPNTSIKIKFLFVKKELYNYCVC